MRRARLSGAFRQAGFTERSSASIISTFDGRAGRWSKSLRRLVYLGSWEPAVSAGVVIPACFASFVLLRCGRHPNEPHRSLLLKGSDVDSQPTSIHHIHPRPLFQTMSDLITISDYILARCVPRHRSPLSPSIEVTFRSSRALAKLVFTSVSNILGFQPDAAERQVGLWRCVMPILPPLQAAKRSPYERPCAADH